MQEAPKTLRIGIATSFHDPAIAIESDGQFFAEAFERPSQVKRAMLMAGIFPAIKELKKLINQSPRTGEYHIRLLYSWKFSWFIKFISKCAYHIAKASLNIPLKTKRKSTPDSVWPGSRILQIWFEDFSKMNTYILKREIFQNHKAAFYNRHTPHHLCHAANGIYTSPFTEAIVMVLDGRGERGSSHFYHFHNNQFHQIASADDSFGHFYADITSCCGYSPRLGEEWKVMGLAAYGELDKNIYDFFDEQYETQGLSYKLKFGDKQIRQLESICGNFRKPQDDPMYAANLAHTAQKFYTDKVCQIAQKLSQLKLSENLVVSGGCALNSSTNGKILGHSDFKALHIPFAPADDGNALGTVLLDYYKSNEWRGAQCSPYLGSEISPTQIKEILKIGGNKFKEFTSKSELINYCAEQLANHKICGWIQGKAEFGPRALGNRSILANPTMLETKNRINSRIKFRESFRPVAPTILENFVSDYFLESQTSPYMERTLIVKPEMRAKIPAAIHKDGSARVQTTNPNWNPLYTGLISEFHKQSGIPVLLNTSLNVMGKPLVHSITDALAIFYSTDIDFLVLNNFIVEK